MKQKCLQYSPRVAGLILIVCILFCNGLVAQRDSSAFRWPEGKRAALTLSFDDARLSQIDNGIPLLNKYGVSCTFYVSPSSLLQRKEGWRNAVLKGHEIANHSLSHPCTGNFDWSRNNALENFTISRIANDIDSANRIIKRELGVDPVSFAFPCGQKFVGRGAQTKSYVPLISTKFNTGRGWLDEGANDPAFCDMSQLMGMELDGKSFNEVLELLETAKSKGQWLILVGHEINDSGDQTTLMSTIDAICAYALNPANGIWIDNVRSVSNYILGRRNREFTGPVRSAVSSNPTRENE